MIQHVLCPECDGEGLITFDFENFYECETCQGIGWIAINDGENKNEEDDS